MNEPIPDTLPTNLKPDPNAAIAELCDSLKACIEQAQHAWRMSPGEIVAAMEGVKMEIVADAFGFVRREKGEEF